MTDRIPRIALIALVACLFRVEPAAASPLAYIANSDDNNVSVIDTDTNAVVKTITGFNHPVHVAVNAAGTRVYVTDVGAAPGAVAVVNTLTNVIITHISIPVFAGTFFTNLVLSPTLPAAYLAYLPDQVAVINTTTNTLGTPITVPVSGGDTIAEVAVNPTGTTLYATKTPSGDISVIDLGTGTETTTITGGGFGAIAVDPTGSFVYAVGESFPGFRDTLIVSDTGTNTVTGSLSVGSSCSMRGLTLDASGSTLYATCGSLGQLLVVDTGALTYTPVTVGFVPAATSITPDGAYVYVTNAVDNTVSVVATATNVVVDTVSVGDEPSSYGQFIGPNFVCGNGVVEPGEGCDDGNLVDGDGCNPSCYAVRDSVVLAAKPLKLTIKAGDTMVLKKVKVSVRNADSNAVGSHKILLTPNTLCTGAYGTADLGAGDYNPITVAATKTVKGIVTIGAFANTMFQLNRKAPIRCTFTLTASNPADFAIDPNPSNNVATMEIDIVDENQPETTTPHETTIVAAKPLSVSIKDGLPSVSKVVKFKAGNADYLPTPEAAASHTISITGLDGDCPAMTVGTPTIGGGATADVQGGKVASGSTTLTLSAAGLTTTSKLSPARCTVTLTANGPAGDSMPANNTTTVVIDVTDYNDL